MAASGDEVWEHENEADVGENQRLLSLYVISASQV